MEFVVIAVIPLFFLVLGAGFLVVSQTTGFVQSAFFNRRQTLANNVIEQSMQRIALAQTQLFHRSRQLEVLSSRLALSNQELARLNEMKSKFLSMVVHDVRTPLASIRGFSEMLARRVTGDKEVRYLKFIGQATDQVNRLVSDLTDLAMIEAGKLKMEKALFDFSGMVHEIIPGISINAQNKGVGLTIGDIQDGMMVNGDKFRLSQVLMNLLNNAVKFTPSGGKVELRVRYDGRQVWVFVKDSGPGIHPGERKRIFEKFYQASHQKDAKLRKQGWGLGLSIAQEVVRAHRGEIGADSPGLGRGSTFWFRVPQK